MLRPAGKPSGSRWTRYLRSSTAARTPRNPHRGRGKIPLCRFAFHIWEIWVITSTLVQIQKLQEGRKLWIGGGGWKSGGLFPHSTKGERKVSAALLRAVRGELHSQLQSYFRSCAEKGMQEQSSGELKHLHTFVLQTHHRVLCNSWETPFIFFNGPRQCFVLLPISYLELRFQLFNQELKCILLYFHLHSYLMLRMNSREVFKHYVWCYSIRSGL